ncbi:MAG: YYY membrane protein [Microgenomates group bacterium GW2011_GWC1_49_7]|nr:MAG: YYY membrane protein [Microgenomates group bacterium GW2011_GWC1_49_7]
MPTSDVALVFQWWGTLFLVGAAAYPLTRRLFRGWFDDGYLFAKAVGMAVVTYLVYLGGMLHIVPFTQGAVWGAMGVVFILGVFLEWGKREKGEKREKRKALIFLVEELFFFAALLFWTWVKGHEPSIRGLEKFMDFGFTRSILNSAFFPAPDMWYANLVINYYYFGHTVMAVLTRLSGIDLTYTFNLMLASIFALTATMSFSIGKQLIRGINGTKGTSGRMQIVGGLLTAWLVTLAGNMQTLYAFTRGYTGDNVVPFWQIAWRIGEFGGLKEFWGKLGEGMNTYWYANATRFIPYTIHEFPSYSFVVSDVHGHVLSLPFVLLAIALLVKIWGDKGDWGRLIFYGFLCGILLMTNALDGPIYLVLLIAVLVSMRQRVSASVTVIAAAGMTSLPFLVHFKSFVNGIAVNCPPALLADTKIGPLIFESVDKCQRSPIWMWWLLWGFFVYCGGWLLWGIKGTKGIKGSEKLLIIFFIFSLLLLIFPEFFYFKDIYPMHFRSNTMFKLGYQAFIMLSVVSAYAIIKLWRKKIFFLFLIPQLFLVSIYPIFSVRSYFNSLRHYEGIFGMAWFQKQYPDDWAAIQWLNLRSTTYDLPPVIVEADGDSYTDYDRFSAFTGLPTVIGWAVHEWLWRGSYDVVAPRREEVRKIYESEDLAETKEILRKFGELGERVFTRGQTAIYRVH